MSVTREELNNLENRIANNQNSLEQRIYGDINGIRNKVDTMSERVIKIEATTESLKTSFEQQKARLDELPNVIIKEITRIALTKEGRELFRNRLNIELGSTLSWVLGITITAIIVAIVGICFAT